MKNCIAKTLIAGWMSVLLILLLAPDSFSMRIGFQTTPIDQADNGLIATQLETFWQNSKNPESTDWSDLEASRIVLTEKVLDTFLRHANTRKNADILIPYPNGELINFTVWPSGLLAPELLKKHPEIETFKGINAYGEILRLDFTPQGLHAAVYTEKDIIYIDPIAESNDEYLSYYISDQRERLETDNFVCDHDKIHSHSTLPSGRTNRTDSEKRSVGDNLTKFRIAITAHESFTSRVGDSNALSTIVTILNRTTGIYERDLAVTFELVAENDQLIMTSSNPGPFNESVVFSFLTSENQVFLDDVIGNDNYDIGHIFASPSAGGGGTAVQKSVCFNGRKASAITGIPVNTSDLNDFIGIFAHEVGHQFGASHTFTNANSCTDGPAQWTQESAMEIGSGSTLMSYARSCGEDNTVSAPEEYFHAISIQQMLDFINLERDNICGQVVSTDNNVPTVDIRESGFTIPINTPFVLEAEGMDEDNDDLTYCWEQFDLATKMENRPGTAYIRGGTRYYSVQEFVDSDEYYTREELEALGQPENIIVFVLEDQESFIESMFEGDGPLFRSFFPNSSNKRYFPQMQKVLAGETSIRDSDFEVLPFKTRELNFVITVRDNSATGGGMTNDMLSFNATEDAGPFIVTYEFSEPQYLGLSNIELTWDVAGTDLAPVNCHNVDILYSVDGGSNFDMILAQNTDNDGIENIRIPNISTTSARIMVKASDNIFFNVNDRNFTVEANLADVPASPSDLIAFRSDENSVNLSWADNSESEQGFIIERKEGDGIFAVLDYLETDVTTFIDQTVSVTSSYVYRVAAYNENGNSPYSNEATVEEGASTGTDIISFVIEQQSSGTTIDNNNHTVTLEMPFGTDVSSLVPAFTLSEGASSDPLSGAVLDFTDPLTITVTAEDGIAVQDWVVTVTLEQQPLSVEPALSLEVYPNPVNDILHVHTEANATVYLTDLSGKRVVETQQGTALEFDLSELRNGLYLLVVQTEDQNKQNRKILKVMVN